MKKFVVKPGMCFVCSDNQIKKEQWRKVYTYRVIKKCGSKFLVSFYDGIMYGSDLFYKWELENMKLISQ